jgi:hypothetical protein
MKHFLSLTIAASLAAALIAPAEAKPKKAQGPKSKGASAAVQKRPAQRVAIKQQTKSRAPRQTARVTRTPSQRQVTVQRGASQRNVATQQRIARERATQRDRLEAIGERRDSSDRKFRSSRSDSRRFEFDSRSREYYRPPYTVYRGWDRGRVHWWNSRPYRWYGGAWVLFDTYYDTPSVSSTLVYSPGTSSRSLVAEVQDALDDAGFDPGPVDGVIGARTRDAIADYQAAYGLPVTGRIDNALLRSLGI